jgi:hypothetical protein
MMAFICGLAVVAIGAGSIVGYKRIAAIGLKIDLFFGAPWSWTENVQLMRALSLGFSVYLVLCGVFLMTRATL